MNVSLVSGQEKAAKCYVAHRKSLKNLLLPAEILCLVCTFHCEPFKRATFLPSMLSHFLTASTQKAREWCEYMLLCSRRAVRFITCRWYISLHLKLKYRIICGDILSSCRSNYLNPLAGACGSVCMCWLSTIALQLSEDAVCYLFLLVNFHPRRRSRPNFAPGIMRLLLILLFCWCVVSPYFVAFFFSFRWIYEHESDDCKCARFIASYILLNRIVK